MYNDLPTLTTADGQQTTGFPILIRNSPTGPKTAVLRLPTSAELLDWFAQQKDVIKTLGRGQTEEVAALTPKADQRLFRTIRIDRLAGADTGDGAGMGVEFDDDEALYALGQITRHRVESCERDGQTFVVVLTTTWTDRLTHTVRIPYESEISKYRRAAVTVRSLPNGYIEQRLNVGAAVELYDSILVSADGYGAGSVVGSVAGSVPPHHKRTVIVKLLTELSLLDPALDPNS